MVTKKFADNDNNNDDLEYVKRRNLQDDDYEQYATPADVAGDIVATAAPVEIAAPEAAAGEVESDSNDDGEAENETEAGPDSAAPAREQGRSQEAGQGQGQRRPYREQRHGGGGGQGQGQGRHGQQRHQGQGQGRGGQQWDRGGDRDRRPKKTKTYQVTLDERFSENPIDWVIGECCGERWNLDIPRKRIKQLLAAGAIKVNGKIERFPNKQVQVGDRLEICLPIEEIQQSNDNERPLPTIEFNDSDIIYQDDAIVVLNKPAGVPSQGTLDPTRDHAYEALRRYLEAKNKGREVYLAIHHRLDSDTSGPLLFCRKKSLNKPVGDLFAERTAKKTYMAIVAVQQPIAKKEWEVDNFLARSKKHPMKMESVHSGGDPAQTSFRVLKQNDQHALIEARPHTGRMHQIRVHLSELGLPILGDFIYGGRTIGELAPRTMLHSWKLEFTHPEDQRPMCAEANVPSDFQAMLDKLGLK